MEERGRTAFTMFYLSNYNVPVAITRNDKTVEIVITRYSDISGCGCFSK